MVDISYRVALVDLYLTLLQGNFPFGSLSSVETWAAKLDYFISGEVDLETVSVIVVYHSYAHRFL